MKRSLGGPFSNDIWSIVECETLIETFDPDVAVVYERGIPFTHIWFTGKVPKVIHPACDEHASSSHESKRTMGNMEIWHNISPQKLCCETNSSRPTFFYISDMYISDEFLQKICEHSKDWIIFVKDVSPLTDSFREYLEKHFSGCVVYYEPIRPDGDPRAVPVRRSVIISPSLVSKAGSLWSMVEGVPRSTCTRMLMIHPPSTEQNSIKLTLSP